MIQTQNLNLNLLFLQPSSFVISLYLSFLQYIKIDHQTVQMEIRKNKLKVFELLAINYSQNENFYLKISTS